MKPLTLSFTTNAVHPRDRFDFWHSVACESYVEHECRAHGPSSFEGHVDVAPLAHILVSTYSNAPARSWRTSHQASRAHSADIFLCLQTNGTTVISQDGRDAMLEPGDFCFVDTTSPFIFDHPVQSEQIMLKVERAHLDMRFPGFRTMMAVGVNGQSAAGGLASSFIQMLPRYRDSITGIAAQRIADQTLDLAALALSEVASRSTSRVKLTSAAAVALVRLRRAIEANLHRNSMRCADVAAAAGMSMRYANRLLVQEGTSLERLIQQRRLEKCRDALRDPARHRTSISEIAFSWGFSDAAHFARSFKTAYGVSPREYRREGCETWN